MRKYADIEKEVIEKFMEQYPELYKEQVLENNDEFMKNVKKIARIVGKRRDGTYKRIICPVCKKECLQIREYITGEIVAVHKLAETKDTAISDISEGCPIGDGYYNMQNYRGPFNEIQR